MTAARAAAAGAVREGMMSELRALAAAFWGRCVACRAVAADGLPVCDDAAHYERWERLPAPLRLALWQAKATA